VRYRTWSYVFKVVCERTCPTAITQGMHFHPDPVLPFVQLQRARTAWYPKVPMMATGAPGQFALAAHDEPAPATFFEDLPSGELEVEFEHSRRR
jgi:hypothetical protein